MSKVGVDDLIAARGPEILRHLMTDAWVYDGGDYPRRIHLSEIENANIGAERVAVDLMVSAVGEAFRLPKRIKLRCVEEEEEQPTKRKKSKKATLKLVTEDGDEDDSASAAKTAAASCKHLDVNDGYWETEVTEHDVLIDMTRVTSRTLRGRAQDVALKRCKNAVFIETLSEQTVTAFLGSPKARRLKLSVSGASAQVVDERGRPFREKFLYASGVVNQASRYFRGVGFSVPNPKSQEATAFFWELVPIGEDYEQFEVTADLAKRFSVFQADEGKVQQQLDAIAVDITNNITLIYGPHRQRSLLGKLLVYHSFRQFRFDGEMLKRGWLELVEVGDTGQGKTQQVDRIMQASGMGEGVDGVSTTRTGLAYSFQKLNDIWFLIWGKYPLNDGKLLFVDEAQNLAPEEIDKIRKGRSDGVIMADGIRSGEHPTRTRLIMTCNPKYTGVVDDELFGIDLLKQTFKDEDIRRFDIAIISASSDDKAQINQPRKKRSGGERLISDEILAASIRWAWSRKPEHVEFTDEATDAVYASARTMSETFGDARDIPLLLESDVRHKIARLAVAAATLVHSTDDKHERVIVTADHIVAVCEFLMSIYTNKNCSFDLYARIRRTEAAMTPKDYTAIWEHLRECKVEKATTLSDDDIAALLRAFVAHEGRISRQDLAGELGKTPEWTSKVVRVLKAERLIRVNHGRAGGYRGTPKFMKFLKLAIERKDLEP
ncbi:MAG: hypothetical protein ACREAA_04855 [Candidatus Polarisedimenticolia bacterium]